MDISKKDWKLFREKLSGWQENYMEKSEVIWDIVRLIRLKVIIYDDLSEFSGELRREVKRILEMNR